MVLHKQSTSPVAWLDSDNTFNGSVTVNGANTVNGTANINGDLTVNGTTTLAGDATVSGELSARDLRLSDGNLWLRSGTDQTSGLGWYGSGQTFNGQTPNGPVLFGNSGGALGTTAFGQLIALSWNSSQQVGIDTLTPGANLDVNGTGHFTGNVGIGTPTPGSKLDVRGNIALGSTGQYQAAGGVETLRILRGHVAGNGTISAGTGFTVTRNSTGNYTINFSTAFSGEPAVTATARTSGSVVATSPTANTASCQIDTLSSGSGTAVDQDFFFIVVGPQ
jgi:hypothetical protein